MNTHYYSNLWLIGFYPFGMPIMGRVSNGESGGYRYGFGGHEKDNEVKGDGNHISFGDYGYDTRLGRRWNLDPIDQIDISNYATFEDDPINMIDPDGQKSGGAQARPQQYYVPNYARRNSYAVNNNGVRLNSTQTTRTTAVSVNGNGNRAPRYAELPPSYIFDFTTPNRNTTQITRVSNPTSFRDYRGELAALVGDIVEIRVKKITQRLNTPTGLKYESREEISFANPQKQSQFTELQAAYTQEFNKRLKSLDDMEMPEDLKGKYGADIMFNLQKMSIVAKEMGSSPTEMLKQYINNNGQEIKTETKTEEIPEFHQGY